MIATYRDVRHLENPAGGAPVELIRRGELLWALRRRKIERAAFGAHPLWRRLTGLTFSHEERVPRKARRHGLKRLLRWIERRFTEDFEERSAAGGTPGKKRATRAAEPQVLSWARAKACGLTVEELCARLQISPARLSRLTREICGLSAQEILDGLRLARLKDALVKDFRAAAFELWGAPGSFVYVKLSRLAAAQSELSSPHRASRREKFPRHADRANFGEDREAERSRRTRELLAQVREGLEIEGVAVGLGFASSARLRRACVNVWGKSLRKVLRELAADLVTYYFCAEARTLREIACGEDNSSTTARARALYLGPGAEDDARPAEPFHDEWSAYEQLRPAWLAKMKAAFG
jgi:methylphosphotriester-DNA--protein-cysteine methyltransferase